MKAFKQVFALSTIAVLLFAASAVHSQSVSAPPNQGKQGVVDKNGDGICDITGQKIGTGAAGSQGRQAQRGNKNGPGDGTGNLGTRPQDGTGYGSQSGKKLGPRDGSQPRIGQGNRTAAGGAQMGGRRGKK